MNYKPTVVFDFDGVISSYASGWQGAGNIPDPPVAGIGYAIEELRQFGYKVVVVSTRCATAEGMGAVRKYLRDYQIEVDDVLAEKPPALCYVDDRAICFKGSVTGLCSQIKAFRSWTENGIPVNDDPVEGLRPCTADYYDKGQLVTITGRLHGFAQVYEEFEQGIGNFTVALVEEDNGKLRSCAVDSVIFLDRTEGIT